MTTPQALLELLLADKAKLRLQARAKSWPEKIATIERLRDAARLAREGMRKRKAAQKQPSTMD